MRLVQLSNAETGRRVARVVDDGVDVVHVGRLGERTFFYSAIESTMLGMYPGSPILAFSA